MAIYIVEGKIGSGKTYYCVYSISRRYYDYDELLLEFIPRKNVTIITNIDSFKLEHISLQNEIDRLGLKTVFSESYISEIRKQNSCRNIIFLIDETQKYFDRKFYDKEIFYFFQYSRHLGVDLYLVTQDIETLSKELRNLPEYIIHAVARSTGSGHSFAYKIIIGGESSKTIVLPHNKHVFSLYRSFNFDELEKPKPVMYRYITMVVGFFILAALAFIFIFIPTFAPSFKSKSPKPALSKPADTKGKVLPANAQGKPSNRVQYREIKQDVPVSTLKPVGHLISSGSRYNLYQDDNGKGSVVKLAVASGPESSVPFKSNFKDGFDLYGTHFLPGSYVPELSGGGRIDAPAEISPAPLAPKPFK